MEKIYSRVNWEDYPSEKTPINSVNLNRMDKGIDDLDNKLALAEQKFIKYPKSKILWRGGIFPGGKVQFSIPKECFHNNNTTVTFVIESYMMASDGEAPKGNSAMIIPISFGNPLDFGIDLDDSAYGPYVDFDGYSTAMIYQNVHETVTDYALSLIKVDISAKKVTDDRYAICSVHVDITSDSGIVVTNISAYVPEEL